MHSKVFVFLPIILITEQKGKVGKMFNIITEDSKKIEILFLFLIFLVVFGMFLIGEISSSAEALSVSENIVINIP